MILIDGNYFQTLRYPVLTAISIAVVAPFSGLRRFREGRKFKQWTGDDSKALMKVCSGTSSLLITNKILVGLPSGNRRPCS
jgi:hypothetical protein